MIFKQFLKSWHESLEKHCQLVKKNLWQKLLRTHKNSEEFWHSNFTNLNMHDMFKIAFEYG